MGCGARRARLGAPARALPPAPPPTCGTAGASGALREAAAPGSLEPGSGRAGAPEGSLLHLWSGCSGRLALFG